MQGMEQVEKKEASDQFDSCCYSWCSKFTPKQTVILRKKFKTNAVEETEGTWRHFSEELFISHDQKSFKRVLTFTKEHCEEITPFKPCVLSKEEQITLKELIQTLRDIYCFLPKGKLSGRNVFVIINFAGEELWEEFLELKKKLPDKQKTALK
jgi:hypothetical protein